MHVHHSSPRSLQEALLGTPASPKDVKAPLSIDLKGTDAQSCLSSHQKIHDMISSFPDFFEGQKIQHVAEAKTNEGTPIKLYNFTAEEIFFTKTSELVIGSIAVMKPNEWIGCALPTIDNSFLRWSNDPCSVAISKNDEGSYNLLESDLGVDKAMLYSINPHTTISPYGDIPNDRFHGLSAQYRGIGHCGDFMASFWADGDE